MLLRLAALCGGLPFARRFNSSGTFPMAAARRPQNDSGVIPVFSGWVGAGRAQVSHRFVLIWRRAHLSPNWTDRLFDCTTLRFAAAAFDGGVSGGRRVLAAVLLAQALPGRGTRCGR